MKTTFRLAIFLAALVSICCSEQVRGGTLFGSGANTFQIDFVPIRNPGNAPDTTGAPNPAGTVNNIFLMGKYEISEDMINKANTLGALAITKDARGANKPATSVSWNEAARFVNWLNTSSGFSPAYKFAVQPGGVGYNANAQIQLWTAGDVNDFDPANPYRSRRAKFWLPNVNEWYKAAYYDPNANSGTGGYWDYPTGSNAAPAPVQNGTAPNTAVYNRPFQDGPADINDAGGLSPYGTMAQGGNVYEWEETDSNLVNGPVTDNRAIRGGFWNFGSVNMTSGNRTNSLAPTNSQNFNGFRVAGIPEPSALMLLAMASLGLFLRRTR